jgi:UDP-N-acetyl-D-glucosamine dehydrogenase
MQIRKKKGKQTVNSMNSLRDKIEENTATIAILGLGHVGHPLASLFSNAGFPVIGYDIDRSVVKRYSKKIIIDGYSVSSNFTATDSPNMLKKADVYIITVPTPLNKCDLPDLSFIVSASETIATVLKKGKLVILVSTAYPETTEKIVKPILEKTGLKAGEDFYLCYCPERFDPGNKTMRIENTPHLVSGINEESRELAIHLYSKILSKHKVVPMSSLKSAEATKILENVFRNVNIAFINEMAKIFEKMHIDIWEVIRAASTKPEGFLAHYPSPGVGGHCIPINPFYLSYIARKYDMDCRFVQLAEDINKSMPYHVVFLVGDALKNKGLSLRGAKVTVLGVTYKENVSDTRQSPAEIIIRELMKEGADVYVFDPCTTETFGGKPVKNMKKAIRDKDCVILTVPHNSFKNIEEMINVINAKTCVVDTRNFIRPELLKKTVTYRCLGK